MKMKRIVFWCKMLIISKSFIYNKHLLDLNLIDLNPNKLFGLADSRLNTRILQKKLNTVKNDFTFKGKIL